MPAVRTIHHTYPVEPRRVFELLCDPDYLRARCQADGDRNIDIEVRGCEVRVERDHSIELPAFVRGLVRPTNRAVEVCQWEQTLEGWHARYVVSARGMPGTLEGTLRIEGDERAARFEASIEVVAHVPLIASKLEALMAEGFVEYLRKNAQHLANTLRGAHAANVELTELDGLQLASS